MTGWNDTYDETHWHFIRTNMEKENTQSASLTYTQSESIPNTDFHYSFVYKLYYTFVAAIGLYMRKHLIT